MTMPSSTSAQPLKLNVGCGRNILEGWVNLDSASLPGIDIQADLERCRDTPLPLADDSVGEFLLSHVLEHIRDALGLMQELYRVARPGATMTIRLPYGSHDDAWEDPTHVRPYFMNSCTYFSQPTYWRADYGYRGDWDVRQLTLTVAASQYQGKDAQTIMKDIMQLRNVVSEMTVELEAIKPAREPKRELLTKPQITINLA